MSASTDLNELYKTVGNIDGKVDILLERTRQFDTRLSAVEKKVWWASGATAAVTAAATYLFTHFLGKTGA
jgi:hypothetical protein